MPNLKILIDEMDDGWDEKLRQLGFDAYSVKKLRVEGKKLRTDYSVINYARENDMVLVTRDTESGQACQENNLPYILLDNDEIFKIVLDKIKGLILTIIFGGGLVYLLSTLYYEVGSMFYLYAWLSIIAIMLLVNLFLVKLFIPIFNKVTPLEDGELKDSIESFAKTTGYEVSKISIIDASKRSTKLNALFTGLGRFKKVLLYDTLVEKMSTEEIVAVLAHEIGHNKHKHVVTGMIQMIIVISIYLGVLLFTLNSPEISRAFGFTDTHFGFGLIIFSVLLAPISVLIGAITSGISRKHEYQADEFARAAGYGVHLESALRVLSKENFSNLTPHPLYVKLTYSHPPVSDRINTIRKNEE